MVHFPWRKFWNKSWEFIFPNKDSTWPFHHLSLKEKKLDNHPVIWHLLERLEGYFKESTWRIKGSAALSINFNDFWKISAFWWSLVSFSIWCTWRRGSLPREASDLCKMSRAFILHGGGIPITLEPRNCLYVWRRTRSEWWLWGIKPI